MRYRIGNFLLDQRRQQRAGLLGICLRRYSRRVRPRYYLRKLQPIVSLSGVARDVFCPRGLGPEGAEVADQALGVASGNGYMPLAKE